MSEQKKISVTAVVAIRNGAFYFQGLCDHAKKNGISLFIIDNDSEDDLQSLIQENLDVIVGSRFVAYDGAFDLIKLLEIKEEVVKGLNSDWFIHMDVDELLFSDMPGERLVDAILRVSKDGYNSINFDEFVFLPVERYKKYCAKSYAQMRWYYFFEPRKTRLMRVFHRSLKTSVSSGGHKLEGDVKLYNKNMIMRHYIFKNREHVNVKYKSRVFSQQDLDNKFHGNRVILKDKNLPLPPRRRLKKCRETDWILDKTDIKLKHFWQWG